MNIIWILIVGGLIGWFAGILIGKNVPGGIIGNIVAGAIGSWLGTYLLGEFGLSLAGFYLLPSLIGAIIFIAIIGLIGKMIE